MNRLSLWIVLCTVVSVSCWLSQLAHAQCPVKLDSISAISSGAPHVDFTFDGDITSYTVSTFKVTTISNGQPTSVAKVATLSQQTPKVLSVPLKLETYAAEQDQSVSITVTLGNTVNSSCLTTPSYFLDLSFLASIKTDQAAIASLLQSKVDLQSQLNQCSQNLQMASQHANPHYLLPHDAALVGAHVVVLHLSTDVYATVQVSEPQTAQTKVSAGKEHYIQFTSLQPSTPYVFTAVPLDATTGKPMIDKQQTIPQATAQDVVFSPVLESLTPTGPTGLAATVNFDPNQNLPQNFKSYIRLYYKAQQPDGTYGTAILVGDGELDPNGVPQGTSYPPGKHTFPIQVSLANTAYLIMFKAYDQYGEERDSTEQGKSTPPVTPALNFKGPVSITMNTNSGLTVSWSGSRPIKTSVLQIKFADGTYLPNIPQATTGSTDSSVTLDINALSALLDKALPSPGKPAPAASKPPQFEISIDDGTNAPDGKASMSFSVSFEITSAKQPKGAVQTAANKVADSATKNKSNISWTDVLKAGLGIVAKVI